jgi:hypothetical protein
LRCGTFRGFRRSGKMKADFRHPRRFHFSESCKNTKMKLSTRFPGDCFSLIQKLRADEIILRKKTPFGLDNVTLLIF